MNTYVVDARLTTGITVTVEAENETAAEEHARWLIGIGEYDQADVCGNSTIAIEGIVLAKEGT